MFKDSKALEYSCYVVCAGAFGIFARWMQLMLARNDEGLFDPSFWNVAVPLVLILASIFYISFIRKYKKEHMHVPDSFYRAFRNVEKPYRIVSWIACGIMVIGAVMLFLSCDADANVIYLRVLAVLGALSGIAFPFVLAAANKPHTGSLNTVCLLQTLPILLFAFWLITCYKQNSISSIGWAYIVELLTASFSMLGFFRVAGFAFGAPDWPKAMFYAMLGATCCIMSLSDERYMGQQILLGGSALMLLTFNWLMITNMRPDKKDFSVPESAPESVPVAETISR